MSSTIRVEAARIPDRDRLLEALRDEGLDATPEDEVGIVVPTGDGDGDGGLFHHVDAEPEGEVGIVVPIGDSGGELFHHVEGVIFSVGAPFVPIEHEGVIYIRPPVG
jgi:hypothetical protein